MSEFMRRINFTRSGKSEQTSIVPLEEAPELIAMAISEIEELTRQVEELKQESEEAEEKYWMER